MTNTKLAADTTEDLDTCLMNSQLAKSQKFDKVTAAYMESVIQKGEWLETEEDLLALKQYRLSSGIGESFANAKDFPAVGGELPFSPFNEVAPDIDEDEDVTKTTFIGRNFRKMTLGGLRQSVLGMTCAAIGSGVLVFPNVAKQIGWINTCVLLILGCFGCWWSLYMLLQRARHHQCLNYIQLTNKAGGKCLERVLQYSILLYMFATCLACTIVITTLFVLVANDAGLSPDITGDPYSGITIFKTVQTLITCYCILYPLSLGKDMSSFKTVSLVGLGCLLLTILIVIFEFPFYAIDYKPAFNGCLQQLPVCWSASTASSAGVILFAFTNQCNVLPVYSELKNPVKRRLIKIITVSIVIVLILYLSITLFGYFSTYQNTPQIILSRPGANVNWQYDWPLVPCQIFIMSTMVTNIVLNYIPFRNSLNFMITRSTNISRRFNLICTFLFQTGTCIVSIVFPNVQSVLSIFGGIASVNIVYIVPLYCYLKLRRDGESLLLPKNILAIVFFSFMCLLGWSASVSTLFQVIYHTEKDNSMLFCQTLQSECCVGGTLASDYPNNVCPDS